tara:strand:+ start:39 stop:506 length:468 start_codon:yes stop_codon:yes gene_type:complete
MKKFKLFLNNTNPGTGLYVFVWVLAMLPANIAVSLLDSFLANMLLKSISDVTVQLFGFVFFIETLMFVSIVIFIYKKFSNIQISKVAIWYYVLNFLSIGRVYSDLQRDLGNLNLEFDIGTLSILLILSWIVNCLIFRQYFIKTKQWQRQRTIFAR